MGAHILSQVGNITRETCGGTKACVVSESHVMPLYGMEVMDSLKAAGYQVVPAVFPAGEASKNLTTLGELLETVANYELTRGDVIVALGGGVTGDVAGLVAALYLRGIKVVQVPTSLLAMVDSSVGGKTAIDIPQGKNLVGAFWQPSAVIADIDCFKTIPHELFTDSCGEVIKHAVLADLELFKTLQKTPLNSGELDERAMANIVARNIRIKRDVVAADEREQGLRQTLNLGHTIGHAVEAAYHFKLGHGSCVAIGLCAMARASAKKGWCSQETAQAIEDLVRAHQLPYDTKIDHEVIEEYAAHDKKRRGDSITIVVPTKIGSVTLRKISRAELRELIDLGCGSGRQP